MTDYTKSKIEDTDNLFWATKLEDVEYILASQILSGSEFVKSLIQENFPETIKDEKWAKSHGTLISEMLNPIKSEPKVFFILCDPRDAFVNTLVWLKQDLVYSDIHHFIGQWYNLIEFYKYEYTGEVLFIKYEDILYDPTDTLTKIGEFIGLKPLYINDNYKYMDRIFKYTGIFNYYISDSLLNDVYNKHKKILNEFGYTELPIEYDNDLLNYMSFLERNGVNINDPEISERIKHIEHIYRHEWNEDDELHKEENGHLFNDEL